MKDAAYFIKKKKKKIFKEKFIPEWQAGNCSAVRYAWGEHAQPGPFGDAPPAFPPLPLPLSPACTR